MFQRLAAALVGLSDDLASVPNPHMVAHYNKMPGNPAPSFDLFRDQACTWYTFIHAS